MSHAPRLVTEEQLAIAVHVIRGAETDHPWKSAYCSPSCMVDTLHLVERIYTALPPNKAAPTDVRVDRRDETFRLMPDVNVALVRMSGEVIKLTDVDDEVGIEAHRREGEDSVGVAALLRTSKGFALVLLGDGIWILRRAGPADLVGV